MADSLRFLTLAEVAEVLNTSVSQIYALVRRGELPAIRLGGRGTWRVEVRVLEDYIEQQYRETKRYVETHPFSESDAEPEPEGSTKD